jgi:diguanylate cyclase (GGDEF)-like protein/PAS domain S-box-containing protein
VTATTKKKAKPARKESELEKLRNELAQVKSDYTKIALEKNFLERAMQDLNFHNNAHDGVVYTDSQDNIVYANPYFLGMMGIEKKADILEKRFPGYMWTNQNDADRLFKDIKAEGFVREREMALLNREGEPVFAMCSAVASKNEKGEVIGTEIMFCNITSKRRFQVELVEQHALMDAILQSTPDPVLVLNADLDIERANIAAEKLFQVDRTGKKKKLDEILAEAGMDLERIAEIHEKFKNGEEFDMETTVGLQHFDVHSAPLKSSKLGWVCVLHDITESKETQEMLQRHAFHDVLTQLPNRAYFSDHLRRANLRPLTEPDYHFAVLFIDLDGLKRVNDKFGHHAGDELLIQFARRLESSIRPGDLAARLGGDEFAIFLDAIEEHSHARQVAGRVRDAILLPYTFKDGQTLKTTASIGIAMSNNEITDTDVLLRNADKAMYQVKERGGDGFEIFSEKMLTEAS